MTKKTPRTSGPSLRSAKVRRDAPDDAPSVFLPLGINLNGRRCVVVGGGRIGARKAKTLAAAGARVVVVAPKISDDLRELRFSGQVEWLPRQYQSKDLDGAVLVVAATNAAALNQAIGRDAEQRGIPVCVASSAADSNIIFPAVHVADGLSVAVHSHGRNCRRSRDLRNALAHWLQAEPGDRVAVVGARREVLSPAILGALRQNGENLFRQAFPDHGLMILDTCRRWEVYLHHPVRCASATALEAVWRRLVPGDDDAFAGEIKTGPAAFHHLLRVACGLDSPLLGETEIVGQIRAAQSAIGEHYAGLNGLVEEVLTQQRRIREATGISRHGGGGWGAIMVAMLAQRLTSRSGRKVVVFGHGRLGQALVRALRRTETEVVVVSRHAPEVNPRLSGTVTVLPLSQASRALVKAHAALFTFEPPETVLVALARRRKLVVADLARRRAEAPSAPSAWLFLDDFERLPQSGREVAKFAAAEHLATRTALSCEVRRWPEGLAQPLRIGTRRSPLALAQMKEAVALLQAMYPSVAVEVVAYDSPGDRDRRTPLPQVAEDDFFTRDLDDALRRGEIQLAVHSAKDVPEILPAGLTVAALTPSLCPWDCLVSGRGEHLAALPSGARVGTSSDRRCAALRRLRPELRSCEIRGPVDDRLRQLQAGKYEALILAAVGLLRLGREEVITQVFSPAEMPVAQGQGALALVVNADHGALLQALAPLSLGLGRQSFPSRKVKVPVEGEQDVAAPGNAARLVGTKPEPSGRLAFPGGTRK